MNLEERNRRIVERACKGETATAIARSMGLSISHVSRTIQERTGYSVKALYAGHGPRQAAPTLVGTKIQTAEAEEWAEKRKRMLDAVFGPE